jgi:hypothetical protein
MGDGAMALLSDKHDISINIDVCYRKLKRTNDTNHTRHGRNRGRHSNRYTVTEARQKGAGKEFLASTHKIDNGAK